MDPSWAYGKQIVEKNSSHHEIGAARANPNRQSERAKHLLLVAGNQANLCRRLRQAGFLRKCAAPLLRLISAKVTAMRSPVDKRQNSASAPFTCGVGSNSWDGSIFCAVLARHF